jgi:GNAT superfamily N-acetyltransferase
MQIRRMEPSDRTELAELICISTNQWYQVNRGLTPFPAGPESTDLFYQIYEALDPGCCLVAENTTNGRLMGSCFMHPRSTHMSLGIMNVHPNYYGRRVAVALLQEVIDESTRRDLPAVRLIQSAMNLDSFSLYTKAGFVPRCSYQDVLISVPETGVDMSSIDTSGVRQATSEDVAEIAALEQHVSGLDREKDARFCIENETGIWEAFVHIDGDGRIDGFLATSKHPASSALGPGITRGDTQAIALMARALSRFSGGAVLGIVPTTSAELVRQLYAWSAQNIEFHFGQTLGPFEPYRGVNLPTYILETG